MAWKMYIQYVGPANFGLTIPVPGTFKDQESAELFYRRNKDAFKQKDGTYGKPIYVEQGKGRKK